MHLVSWEILKRPIAEGGLQIQDSTPTNLALGGKLLWKLYAEKNHPVNKIFRMKYLNGSSLRKITSSSSPTGTSIWNLCRKGLDKFTQ